MGLAHLSIIYELKTELMIYSGTFLKVKDNSGAKRVQAIKIFNKSLRKGISLAGLILITIKESIMKKNSKIKKTKIQRAVVVNEKKKKKKKKKEGVFYKKKKKKKKKKK